MNIFKLQMKELISGRPSKLCTQLRLAVNRKPEKNFRLERD